MHQQRTPAEGGVYLLGRRRGGNSEHRVGIRLHRSQYPPEAVPSRTDTFHGTWLAKLVMTIEQDRASDRRIAIAFAAVTVVEVVLAFLADAGTYPLWVWLLLAVGAVLIVGAVFGVVRSRAEGTPVWGHRHRPE